MSICKECDHPIKFKGLCDYHYRKSKPYSSQKIRERQRLELMDILGGRKCNNPDCLVPNGCKDIRCLQIDHINGDGYKDRKRFKHFNRIYKYYHDHPEEAREKLQVLCGNCNYIKRVVRHESHRRHT